MAKPAPMTDLPSYTATLDLYRLMRGQEPDTHWKALLRIATASESTWRIFSDKIDLEKGQIDVESLEHPSSTLSHGETLLVGLALNLLRGHGSTDIATLAELLDPNHWQAAIEAIQIYRSGFAGSPTKANTLEAISTLNLRSQDLKLPEANPLSEVRSKLLDLGIPFLNQAKQTPGVTRIALVGSLTTPKLDPRDIDFLVTITEDCDLAALALLGRQLKGRAQSIGRGADIFLANPKGEYIGRTCEWKDCRPFIRMRCEALHCGRRPHLYDDLKVLNLASSLVKEPPLEPWPSEESRTHLGGFCLVFSQYRLP